MLNSMKGFSSNYQNVTKEICMGFSPNEETENIDHIEGDYYDDQSEHKDNLCYDMNHDIFTKKYNDFESLMLIQRIQFV